MFTGIIQSIGTIRSIESKGGDVRLAIETGKLSMKDATVGESIAVNGVCLTAIELDESYFQADASRETLSRTTLGSSKVGLPVNLEMALKPTTRMGGHIVSGHVDGVGTITNQHADGRSVRCRIKVADDLCKYITEKGSICVDGISLTVNSVEGCFIGVNIVPHTLSKTTLGVYSAGQRVNIEVDLLARYLERLMLGDRAGTLGREGLKNAGFI